MARVGVGPLRLPGLALPDLEGVCGVTESAVAWPLLLTLLNLPQLSIMISLLVSANLAERTSVARALADHETLLALSRLNRRQLEILEAQDKILDILKTAAERGARPAS